MKQQDVVKVVVAVTVGGAVLYWLTRPRAQLAPPLRPALTPAPSPEVPQAPRRPAPPPPKTALQGASLSTVLGTRYAMVATASHTAVSDAGIGMLSNDVANAVRRTYLNIDGAPAGRWVSSPSVVQDDSIWSATTNVSVIFEVTVPGDQATIARTIAQRLGTQLATIRHIDNLFSVTWSPVSVQPLPSYMS